jgi:hypothetical protein
MEVGVRLSGAWARVASVVALACLVFAGTARAQSGTAALYGKVTDQSDAALPGVTVTITNAAAGITRSTVSGNAARSGGGIENSDRLGGAGVLVKNSTVAHNSAQNKGGGILNSSSIDEDNPNSVFLVNSIAALNTAPNSPDVADGVARFSLIGDGTGSGISNTDGNQVGKVSPNSSRIDPQIGTLANNGGPTRTHSLLAGSPAIDAASNTDCPAKDQRGVARPQGAGCDIGSYER